MRKSSIIEPLALGADVSDHVPTRLGGMKKLTAAAAIIALTAAAVAFTATAASASTTTDPALPAPGPDQQQVTEYYVSHIYPCDSDQTVTRVTIDQAITQEFNGTWYTVSHGRYVKDTSVTVTVYPKDYQCGVVYSPPPAEYPLPSDFLPLWTGASTPAAAPVVAPTVAPQADPPAAIPAAAPTAPVAAPAPVSVPAAVVQVPSATISEWQRMAHRIS